jgi:hypothetical protein
VHTGACALCKTYLTKQYNWFSNFRSVYLELKAKPYFRLVAVEPDHILDFDGDSQILEMHDRIIVGLARRIGAPVLSTDQQIRRAATVSVVW